MPRKISQTKIRTGVTKNASISRAWSETGHDVPVADGRDRDHREIEDVRDGDVAVDLVPQAVAVEQEDEEHRRDQQQHEASPQQQGDFRRRAARRIRIGGASRRARRGCGASCGVPSRVEPS